MKRLRALVSVGRTTHRGASSTRMVVGIILWSPLPCLRFQKPSSLLAPGCVPGDERGFDAGFLDIGKTPVKRGLVHQSAGFWS